MGHPPSLTTHCRGVQRGSKQEGASGPRIFQIILRTKLFKHFLGIKLETKSSRSHHPKILKFSKFSIFLPTFNFFYIFVFSRVCMLDESSSRGLTPRATCSLVVPLLTSLNPYSYISIVCIFNCPIKCHSVPHYFIYFIKIIYEGETFSSLFPCVLCIINVLTDHGIFCTQY